MASVTQDFRDPNINFNQLQNVRIDKTNHAQTNTTYRDNLTPHRHHRSHQSHKQDGSSQPNHIRNKADSSANFDSSVSTADVTRRHNGTSRSGNDEQSKEKTVRTMKQEKDDFVIPPPTRKFTTTNPSTMSPTYHLFYDLTNPVSTSEVNSYPSPSERNPTERNPSYNEKQIVRTSLTSATTPSTISTPFDNNSRQIQRFSESNTSAFKDGPVVYDQNVGENMDNHSAITPPGSRDQRVLFATSVPSSLQTINGDTKGDTKGPFTCHFPTDEAISSDRKESDIRAPFLNRQSSVIENVVGGQRGIGANKIPDNHDFFSSSGGVNSGFPRATKRKCNDKCDLEESVSRSVIVGDAQNISAWLPPPLPERRPRVNLSVNSDKVSQKQHISLHQHVSPEVRIINSDVSEQFSSRVNFTNNLNNTQGLTHCDKDTTSDSLTRGVSVKNAISFWSNQNDYHEIDDSCQELLQHSSADSGIKLSVSVDSPSSAKRAVFKREGDCVRLFIVNEESEKTNGTSDKTELSVNKDFSHITRSNSVSQILNTGISKVDIKSDPNTGINNPFLNTPTSTSKSGKLSSSNKGIKRSNSKSLKFSKFLGSKKSPPQAEQTKIPVVSKKPVNRWDNIHVLSSGQTQHVLNFQEQTTLTKVSSRVPSKPTSDYHRLDPCLSSDVTLRDSGNFLTQHNEEVNGDENKPWSRPVIKGILVNKDNNPNTQRLGGVHAHKVNSVQFRDDTLVDRNILKSTTPQSLSSLGVHSTENITKREVIDRSKYIINPGEAKKSKHFLNQSHDGVLRVDNLEGQCFDPVTVSNIQSGCNQLQISGSSIIHDSEGKSSLLSVISPIKKESCLHRVNTGSNSDFFVHGHSRGREDQQFSEPSPGDHRHRETFTRQISSLDRTTRSDYDPSNINEDITSKHKSPQQSHLVQGHVKGHVTERLISFHSRDGSDISTGEETLNYRKNLREQCKKTLSSNTGVQRDNIGVKKDNQSSKSEFDTNTTTSETTFWENQQNSSNSAKITPRQKFEIRHNRVTERVAINLRSPNTEPEHVVERLTSSQNLQTPHSVSQTPKGVILNSGALTLHKESPRAKFERDRAARTHAISGAHISSVGSTDVHTEHSNSVGDCSAFSTVEKSQVILKNNGVESRSLLNSILSPRVRVDTRRCQLTDTVPEVYDPNFRAVDCDKGFTRHVQSNWINTNPRLDKRLNSTGHLDLEQVDHRSVHTGLAIQLNQRIDSKFRSIPELTEELKIRGEESARVAWDNNLEYSRTRSISGKANIDKDLCSTSGEISEARPRHNTRTANEGLSHISDIRRTSGVGENTSVTSVSSSCPNQVSSGGHLDTYESSLTAFSSCKNSTLVSNGGQLIKDNAPELPPRSCNKTSGYVAPGALSDMAVPVQRSAMKKMSPDSVSSSGYESEHNFSAQNSSRINNNNFGVSSTVQQLRLRFGHQNINRNNSNNLQTVNTSLSGTNGQYTHSCRRNNLINRQYSSLERQTPTLTNSRRHSSGDFIDDIPSYDIPSDINNNVTPTNLNEKKNDYLTLPYQAATQSNNSLIPERSARLSANPSDKHRKGLDKLDRSMLGIISDLSNEQNGRVNGKRSQKQKRSSKSFKKNNRNSPNKSVDSSRSNSADTCSGSNRSTSSSLDRKALAELSGLHKNLNTNSVNYNQEIRVFSLDDANMLASKGLRIYETGGEYIAMKSPVKSPLHHKTVTSPHFRWEGATYLVMPTVVGAFSPTGSVTSPTSVHQPSPGNSHSHFLGNNLGEVTTHRSISDSGAPQTMSSEFSEIIYSKPNNSKYYLGRQHNSLNLEGELHGGRDEFGDSYLSMNNKSNLNNRAMSVDVLYAETPLSPSSLTMSPFMSMPEDSNRHGHISRNRQGSRDSGPGYVEWRTCSSWIDKPDKKKFHKDGRNSRGYVEFDTVWAMGAPWKKDVHDDEHVYDVIGEENSQSAEPLTPTSTGVANGNIVVSVSLDTPPALPERTYINRLKTNSGSGSKTNGSRHCSHHHHHHHTNNSTDSNHTSHSCSSSHSSSNHTQCHHSRSKKHRHNHHHHHHQHQDKEHNKQPSSTRTSKERKHSSDSDTKLKGTESPGRPSDVCSDPGSQDYATVSKLRGYKFTNLMSSADSPLPHVPDKSAIYSENYMRLAPINSEERTASWQSGDVLDYIDGLHDSMSPKRRENIYILLNNRKTRAKFSESLEIESRLLSKGLLTSPMVRHNSVDSDDVFNLSDTSDIMNNTDIMNLHIQDSGGHPGIPKKKVRAPVSSTYV